MNILKTLAAAAAIAVSFAGLAQAKDDLSPADKAGMHSYVLSMDKIKGMNDAMKDFEALGKADHSFDMKYIGDQSKSFAEMESKVNANPKVMAVLRKHGLTAHDMVFMPFVLMYAGMSAEYPSAGAKLTDETSTAQVTFYKAHKAELEKIDFISGR
jgi:hypothetical protein